MKNLCFLFISCVALFSCSDKAATETAKPQAVNYKGNPSACKSDNFAYLASIQNQQCTEKIDEQSVANVKMELCQGVKQCNDNVASCRTADQCKVTAGVAVADNKSCKPSCCTSGKKDGMASSLTSKPAKTSPVKDASASL